MNLHSLTVKTARTLAWTLLADAVGLLLSVPKCFAGAGTEAASFLEIPVGGRAAALGASYSALADDAYAPVWNPGGLGFLRSTQLATMHLAYLETITYDFASLAFPLGRGRALGASAQYLNPGSVAATDVTGAGIGSFSGHYAAYSLAYGQRFGDALALGISGKTLDARISDVSARAYAADAGAMLEASRRLRFALVAANLGEKMTFIDQADALPAELRLGALYAALDSLRLTVEGNHAFNGLNSLHAGAEWLPVPLAALRVGYRTDTTSGLSAIAGLTTGVGLQFWGQEFDYAWVPLGDLGKTNYFSLLLRFGGSGTGAAGSR